MDGPTGSLVDFFFTVSSLYFPPSVLFLLTFCPYLVLLIIARLQCLGVGQLISCWLSSHMNSMTFSDKAFSNLNGLNKSSSDHK